MLQAEPDPSVRMANHHEIVLLCATPPPSPGAIEALQARLRKTTREHGRAGLLIAYDFSRFTGSLPDSEMRGRMAAMIRETHLFGMAVVVDREGFFGAAVRSMVTGVLMVARVPFRVRVFSEPDEACRWLSAQPERDPLDPAALIDALRRLRASAE